MEFRRTVWAATLFGLLHGKDALVVPFEDSASASRGRVLATARGLSELFGEGLPKVSETAKAVTAGVLVG